MKKIIALLSAALMSLSLCACGSPADDPAPNTSGTPKTEDIQKDAEKSAETSQNTQAESESSAENTDDAAKTDE